MENLWGMVAKARGVELGEEFRWRGLRYKVTEYDGLLVSDGSLVVSSHAIEFVKGVGRIEKIPFRPQIDDSYYTIINENEVIISLWANRSIDYTRLIAGVIFRTREEAEAYVPTWLDRISKL